MTYKEKLEIANEYLWDKVGIDWEELPDINSLHDCETIEEIHNACEERLHYDTYN